jgi:uncharacterized protein
MMREHRSVEFRDVELRDMNFRGYAAVFDTPWNDRLTEETGYIEKVKPGAFRKALARTEDVPLLWQHDRHQLLATTKANTLQLKEDHRGLLVEARLPKTGLGEYAREMIERGDVRGMSYGREFGPSDTKLENRSGVYYRLVTGAKRLLDVSLTWEPAYASTQVELRSAGFVAVPLQELLVAEESESKQAVTEPPPDEDKPEAWWEAEEPAEAEGESKPSTQWWEKEIDVLEL